MKQVVYTKNGKDIRVGDILQGKQSQPVLVIFDEHSQDYRVVIIDAKIRKDVYGTELQSKISYGFVSFSLEEFTENHPDFVVLFNLISLDLAAQSRNIGEAYSDKWALLKLQDGNYNG